MFIMSKKNNNDIITPLNDDELFEDVKKDRYNLVYIILFIHGVGVLMPWNMFITANEYFVNFKLNVKDEKLKAEADLYRSYFLSLVGVVSNVPSVTLNMLNLFCQFDCLGSISRRILSAIVVITLLFLLNVILAMVDSSTWPAQFFWITMASIVLINMANGIYQNSIYGTAAMFPMKYTNAVLMGSNFSGLLTTIIAIASYLASPDIQTSAIYYFLAAIFTLLIAFDTYLALPSLDYFKYYKSKAKRQMDKREKDVSNYFGQFWITFKKCWIQDFCVFLVFVVTLACFPAITASVMPSSPDFFLQGPMFSFITCFLMFNLFSILGCFTTEFIKFPGPKYIWIPVLLRLLFVPFFMLSNYKPEVRNLPVAIGNDYAYTIGVILLAYTNGYLSSLCMMYAPSLVEVSLKGIAGMMSGLFLVMGVFCGILMSFPLIYIIEHTGSFQQLNYLTNSTVIP